MSAESSGATACLPERILVLENPFCKNAARGNRQLPDLIEFSGLASDTVQTDRDFAVTADRLKNVLEPTDLLYVIGGDGTVNQTLEPLIRSQALLLPTRSGNANDLALSMNGRRAPWKIFSDFKHGMASDVKVHPIEVTINSNDLQEIGYAVNYASFGYAALASHYLNQPWQHPRFQQAYYKLPALAQNLVGLSREGYLLGKAAVDAEPFQYSDQDYAVDITAVHSKRMAKLGRFNVQHTDPCMFAVHLPQAGVLAIGKEVAKMAQGKTAGEYVSHLAFSVGPTGSALYYQLDGEAHPLPNHSNISIGLARDSVRILTRSTGVPYDRK
ncbi:MAG: hypothetical protein JWO41_719 [Candidatus Saccharibacteria bacterium]|nr:hypothetical protein [Candidatus Saccharibacteria bacterium]